MEFLFTVHAPPLGFYAQASRNLYKMSPDQRERAKKYRDWQAFLRIQYLKNRQEIGAKMGWNFAPPPLPLTATIALPIWIETAAYFQNKRHPDPENVHKAVVDALFYKSDTGDKYTGGKFEIPQYDPDHPRVEIRITGLVSYPKEFGGEK